MSEYGVQKRAKESACHVAGGWGLFDKTPVNASLQMPEEWREWTHNYHPYNHHMHYAQGLRRSWPVAGEEVLAEKNAWATDCPRVGHQSINGNLRATTVRYPLYGPLV